MERLETERYNDVAWGVRRLTESTFCGRVATTLLKGSFLFVFIFRLIQRDHAHACTHKTNYLQELVVLLLMVMSSTAARMLMLLVVC